MQEFEPPAEVMAFLADIGAGSTPHHAGRTLARHLVATYTILRCWQQNEPVAIAGLCHSLYGTDAFNTACLGPQDRDTVKNVIGEEAEHLAFLFGAMRREAFLAAPGCGHIENRFTNGRDRVSPTDCSALCHILLANELDLVIAKKGPGKPGKVAKKVGPVFESVKPWLSREAVSYFDSLTHIAGG